MAAPVPFLASGAALCYIEKQKEKAKGAEAVKKVLTVGIAGGTGSGKTTVTRRLQRLFGEAVCVVYHDDYYKAHHELSYDERCKINYDEPAAFDTELLLAQLDELRAGRSVECPVYDYTIHDRSEQTKRLQTAPILLVEGILLLENEELCRRLDIKVFVDTDADVRILRRIVRDVRDRKRSLESVVNQYITTVKPMHERYVEPSRRHADIIIPEGGHNEVAMSLLAERLRAHLQEEEHG